MERRDQEHGGFCGCGHQAGQAHQTIRSASPIAPFTKPDEEGDSVRWREYAA
jgi:hypothetical protein